MREGEGSELHVERTNEPARRWRAGKRERARARAQPTPGKTAHHICQPLCCENISSVDKPVEDARGLQYLVDALRRVGQLLLCVRQKGGHVSLRVRVLQACALLPGSQPPLY